MPYFEKYRNRKLQQDTNEAGGKKYWLSAYVHFNPDSFTVQIIQILALYLYSFGSITKRSLMFIK